jgi:hypothetical protein
MPPQLVTPSAPASTEPAAEPQTTPAAASTPIEPSAPAAPAEPAEPKDISDVVREKFSDKLLGKSKKAKAKEKPEPKPEPAPEPQATPAPEHAAAQPTPAPAAAPVPAPTEPEPAPVKVSRTPKPPQMTPEQIAKLAAEAAAEVATRNQPQQPAAPAFELPDELKPMAEVYEQLEKLNPSKYKGIGRKQAEFLQKEMEYADQWVQREIQRLGADYDPQNPPQFNPDDAQHASFYRRHEPAIDPADLDEARFEARFNKRVEKLVKPQLETYEQEIARIKAEPVAENLANTFGTQLFVELNPEVKQVTPEAYQQWAEANPVEAELAQEVYNEVKPAVKAMSLLWDGAIQPNMQDAAHATAFRVFEEFEQRLANAATPVVVGGKRWIRLADYNALPASERKKYVTTTKDDLVEFVRLNVAAQVKNLAAERRALAEKLAPKLGFTKGGVSNVTGQPAAPTPTAPAPAVHSPSIGSSAPTPATTGVAPKPTPQKVDRLSRMLGSR